ncbi:BA14K family protein [Rhizobium sp. SSA_523]|nr:BA14K family protein [Rhizobium sp. SSA_523]MCO5731083.1 BA14K family protein [Rhizobium sp. SSA_523]WKC25840.1 BA14K family protein [Rhizobium sp. SSA_523]
MKDMFKTLTVAGLTACIMAVSVVPSQAMPVAAAPKAPLTETATAPSAGAPLVNVQYRRDYYDRGWDRRSDRRWDRRWDRRHHRHHSRGDVLLPLAAGALIAGAVIAGSSQPRYAPAPSRGGINPSHYDWCSARYRSYDSYSNTFQPYSGPRQQCLSPYY